MVVKKGNENRALNSLVLFNLFLKALLFFAPNLIADVELTCSNYFTVWLCMAYHFIGSNGVSRMAGEQGQIEL